jgi:hypothetical protein
MGVSGHRIFEQEFRDSVFVTRSCGTPFSFEEEFRDTTFLNKVSGHRVFELTGVSGHRIFNRSFGTQYF